MKQKFSEDEINVIVQKYLMDQSVEQICNEYHISTATFHRWKSKYLDINEEILRRLNRLELENSILKQMYAEEKLFNRLKITP